MFTTYLQSLLLEVKHGFMWILKIHKCKKFNFLHLSLSCRVAVWKPLKSFPQRNWNCHVCWPLAGPKSFEIKKVGNLTATLCFFSCRAGILLSLVPTPEQFGVRNMKKHTWAIIKKSSTVLKCAKKYIWHCLFWLHLPWTKNRNFRV